jgi:bidirectional [NiFe] hydrogenase diaphorase subunit
MTINGREVTGEPGQTVLQAAKAAGIYIPALCNSDKTKPYGACRVCMVEVTKGKRTRLVASCCYPVEDGIVVQTDTEKVKKIRKLVAELLWPAALPLAMEMGLTSSRFKGQHGECSLCGLCVRYCDEVKKQNSVYFEGRGIEREVAFTPGMHVDCRACRECFDLCTGGWIMNEASKAFE